MEFVAWSSARSAEKALKCVPQKRGSPGVDGMTVEELPEYLRAHWPAIREQLLAGSYQPEAVRRVEIPKSGGGVRQLGMRSWWHVGAHEALHFALPGGYFEVTLGVPRLA